MRFTVKAPASSANLGPGFDAIGIALDLWNTVTIDTEGPAGQVTNTGPEAALLEGVDNLTIAAMEMLTRDVKRDLPPFSIVADTHIPVARGLGSSAAALVAGLVAANRLLDLGLTTDQLFKYAWRMEGHGDNVGAALYGGVVLAVPSVNHATLLWQGEELGLTTVVFVPEATGATWAARAALPNDIPHADAVLNVATAAGLAIGLKTADHELIAAGMRDMLHEPYRARLFPHLDALKATARDHGAIGAALSGAGPSVLALVPPDRADDVAEAFATAAMRLVVPGRVAHLAPVAEGVQVEEE
ncbi:MAG: homoserine kinase [Chloroflexia bacterium]|nr:homoserine kinase [Chloroflexia bacterium]